MHYVTIISTKMLKVLKLVFHMITDYMITLLKIAQLSSHDRDGNICHMIHWGRLWEAVKCSRKS